MTIIKLRSSDQKIFETEEIIAKCSGTIKTMLEDCGMNNEEDTLVPLPNVKSDILRRVLEWAEHHKNDPAPLHVDEMTEYRTDDISKWDAEFLNIDQAALFDLILAANYLDIKALLDVTCKTVANMIKGKTPDEIRKTFDTKKDVTMAEDGSNSKVTEAESAKMSISE